MNTQDKFAAFRDAVGKFAPDLTDLAYMYNLALLRCSQMEKFEDFTYVVDLKERRSLSFVPRQHFQITFKHKNPDVIRIFYLVEDPLQDMKWQQRIETVDLEHTKATLSEMLTEFSALVTRNAAVDLVAAAKACMGTQFLWQWEFDSGSTEGNWTSYVSPSCIAELTNFDRTDEWDVSLENNDGSSSFAYTASGVAMPALDVIARLEPILKLPYSSQKNLGESGFEKLFR